MITVQQIKQMRDSNITSLELLSVLLATENEIRIDDLCHATNIKRRTLELMVKAKNDLLQRKFRLEKPNGFEGAPRTKVIVRTPKATEILNDIFE